MKTQTCCFIGQRDIEPSEYAALDQRLEEEIVKLINQDVRYFTVGGDTGFDSIAAITVTRLKMEYPHIQLVLVRPFKAYARALDRPSKKIYNQIRRKADKVVYISRRYTPGCIFARCQHLAESSAFCLCYLAGPKSGIAHTIRCARRQGLRVINLAPPPLHIPLPPP